ncbi:plancitoxin-1-like [Aulostomus maculatus]
MHQEVVMWRMVLATALLSCSSEADVTCRDEDDREVDWFILYKAPKKDSLTGLEYLYIDSDGVRQQNTMTTSSHSPGVNTRPPSPYRDINHPNGILANTLRPLFTPIRSMSQNFGFISYSDQPPGCSVMKTFGHSKGVLLVDMTSTGVWLLHSTPQFPFRRDQNHFWPTSGNANAQMFLCVTFRYAQFKAIGKHLQYIGAFPFDHDIPDNFHQELKNAVKWISLQPQQSFQHLESKGHQAFSSLSKGQSQSTKVSVPHVGGPVEQWSSLWPPARRLWVEQWSSLWPPARRLWVEPRLQHGVFLYGDLYVTISKQREVRSNVHVQTWGNQQKRARSYCPRPRPRHHHHHHHHHHHPQQKDDDEYKVINIKSIHTDLGDWSSMSDHSKWCVAEDQNKHWTCIGDVNRAKSQYERRGGALCINHEEIRKIFFSFAKGEELCLKRNLVEFIFDPFDLESFLNCGHVSDPVQHNPTPKMG